MIPFITRLRANDLHPMIQYKDALHRGDPQEVTSISSRVNKSGDGYIVHFSNRGERSPVIMRDGGTFSHGTSSAYEPRNDDLHQMNRR